MGLLITMTFIVVGCKGVSPYSIVFCLIYLLDLFGVDLGYAGDHIILDSIY